MMTRLTTTSRLLISVDWLHRCKLPLDVPDGGLCCLYGSSFAGSFTNTYNASAAIPYDAADICEVEADQPVDHQQIRDGADGKAGPLLGVTGITGAGLVVVANRSEEQIRQFFEQVKDRVRS
jgi:hypothetical protein